ncbi:MAG: class I tRNA ligase family protein [Patescibacteria group bacterium]
MAVFDFKKTEERIRHFWESEQIFEKSLELRSKEEHFVFFEGPPTANGLPHIGHFLTRVFKDLYGRYKTMRGYSVLRRAGWDTHGLPIEIEIEKELGFKNKKQIEEYGIAKFNQKAKENAKKYKGLWEQMTKRMGFWLDLHDPYVTYETSYIESVWNIIKTIWDKDLLYQAHRVVPFCTRCGTGLSSHEVAQGYKLVKENSVYLKFKLTKNDKFSENTFILAWTTTPWTLPGNVALAVGKDIRYVKIKPKDSEETYILAKDLLLKVFPQFDGAELGFIDGNDLVGLEYEPLFDVSQLKSEKSYHIYAAPFVSTTDGTGVVHTAVMYGEDDYALGTELGLPKVHTVDLQGKFIGVSSDLDGMYVKTAKTTEVILAKLKATGTLFKEEEYEHDYPFCWRCDTALIYYAKTSWFIKMSAVNKQLLKNNDQINWIPSHLKEGRFGQWIKEGKDWAFSRERYWGTPLPVWQCANADCETYRVAGSLDDLKKNRFKKPNEFILARHGLTDRGSVEKNMIINSYTGEYDIYELNDEGRKQIADMADKLKKEKIGIIIVSPFKRTQGTAKIISEVLGIPVETDERLGEIKHGLACEGKTHAQCVEQLGTIVAMDARRGDGDSWRDVKARMMAVVVELDKKYEGKNILIISHGDPLWILASAMMNRDDADTLAKKSEIYLKQGTYMKATLPNYPYNDQGDVDLHRPYVDEIVLKCSKCDGPMYKVPDLIDVWFDSGCMPYAQWHWPFENKEIFERQFPADFIVEAVDQTRGWFYTLLAISTLLNKGAPYRNVISLGHTLDEHGKKMSKSKGNVIAPDEFMDAVGVDATRWYFYTANMPGESTVVTLKDAQERLKGFFTTLENCVRFYELYEKLPPRRGQEQEPTVLDQWMLSRLNRTILEATKRMDAYDPTTAARMIEKFVIDDLSKWWLRRSRNRPEAIGVLRYLLFEVTKMIAPFAPYTAEDIYARIGGQSEGTESVHLQRWPIGDVKMVNSELESAMIRIQEFVTQGLALRKNEQLKVRQPLQAVIIPSDPLDPGLEALIKDELNVKDIRYQKAGLPAEAKLSFDLAISDELRAEGYAREMMRQIQDMRKDAGYRFDEEVVAYWHSEDAALSNAITEWSVAIKTDTVLSELLRQPKADRAYDVEEEIKLAPGKKIWIGIKK